MQIAVPQELSTGVLRGTGGRPRFVIHPEQVPRISDAAEAARIARQNCVLAAEGNDVWPRFDSFPDEAQHSRVAEVESRTARDGFWIDKRQAYCRLCDEPVGNLTTHSGYWDHCNLLLFLRVVATYRRTWSYADVVSAQPWALAVARARDSVDGARATIDHDSAARRARIGAMLVELSRPPVANPQAHGSATLAGTLRRALQGEWGWAMGGMGERQFRSAIGRVIVPLLPPMSAQLQTRFQQKCWGRKNLEMLYDVVDVGAIEESYGNPRREEKNDKASLMRQLLSELLFIDATGCVDGDLRCAELDLVERADAPATGAADVVEGLRDTGVCDVSRDVRAAAVEWLVAQLAFELVHLVTAHYVGRAMTLWLRHGCPSPEQLSAMDVP